MFIYNDLYIIYNFVQYFMTQIETLFFGSAFSALTTGDFLLIMFAGLVPLLFTVPLAIKFFQNNANRIDGA